MAMLHMIGFEAAEYEDVWQGTGAAIPFRTTTNAPALTHSGRLMHRANLQTQLG